MARQASPTLTRQMARDILVRVARDNAFADRALNAALGRANFGERDRAFVTELVYGTLRHLGWLDHCLLQHLRHPLDRLPQPVVAALRLGAYQILHMRLPIHSAVNESVALLRSYGRLTGLANAVLRRVAAAAPQQAAPEEHCNAVELARWGSHPTALVEEVAHERGLAAARAWIVANNEPAPLGLRVNLNRGPRAEVLRQLAAKGVQGEVPKAPFDLGDSLIVRRAGAVVSLPGFTDGLWTVQDPAATLVGHLAALRPGDRVLDCCAAPGGKATHAAELVGASGHVFAVDRHAAKIALIERSAARLGLANMSVHCSDATDPAGLAAVLQSRQMAAVDVAIVDAPCSGLGTLRRHPELRQKPMDRMAEILAAQERVLDAAATCLRVGGVLIYAVCTVTRAEGEQQIAAFCQRHQDFHVEAPPSHLRPWTSGQFLRTWSDLHDSDSFFAARLVRTAVR